MEHYSHQGFFRTLPVTQYPPCWCSDSHFVGFPSGTFFHIFSHFSVMSPVSCAWLLIPATLSHWILILNLLLPPLLPNQPLHCWVCPHVQESTK